LVSHDRRAKDTCVQMTRLRVISVDPFPFTRLGLSMTAHRASTTGDTPHEFVAAVIDELVGRGVATRTQLVGNRRLERAIEAFHAATGASEVHIATIIGRRPLRAASNPAAALANRCMSALSAAKPQPDTPPTGARAAAPVDNSTPNAGNSRGRTHPPSTDARARARFKRTGQTRGPRLSMTHRAMRAITARRAATALVAAVVAVLAVARSTQRSRPAIGRQAVKPSRRRPPTSQSNRAVHNHHR
jgi:hypothetical protein